MTSCMPPASSKNPLEHDCLLRRQACEGSTGCLQIRVGFGDQERTTSPASLIPRSLESSAQRSCRPSERSKGTCASSSAFGSSHGSPRPGFPHVDPKIAEALRGWLKEMANNSSGRRSSQRRAFLLDYRYLIRV